MTSGAGDAARPDSGSAVPFVIPGPPPARETLAGWQQWRTTRGSFTPAPHLDLATWRAMSPRRRMLHDLHRAATHANLPLQQTPMSHDMTRLLRGRIETNALKRKPSTRAGVMITGGGYQGKTETACEVAAGFEDAWLELHHHLNPDAVPGTRDLHAPVAYVQTPVTAKPKSTCKAILGFYGADTKNMDLPDLVRQVPASISDHETKALLLDDIARVLEATQTERRFDVIELDRFRYDTPPRITAWTRHLAGIEQQLRLMDAGPGMLTDGVMPEYLYRRTDGVVGLLERLIEDGCREAIDTGTERLTQALLDTVVLSLAGAPGRDAEAGEIPAVPPGPARPGGSETRKRKRGRSTVFDDRGPASGAGA